jgi:putative ABC transport system ATP-binding protein
MAHMGTVALSARQVTKRVTDGRARREVLTNVSIDLTRGELAVIRGASGSGKTTLLAVLGGMLLPTSGEVWLDGEPVSRLRDHQRAEIRRAKVGYLFQDFGLIEQMSVLDNLLLPLVPQGHAARTISRALALLERFGIGTLARASVSALSGGERQRVALARARMLEPPLLLLDEPTAHLDETRARALMDDLAGLSQDGTAVLIASHDPRVCEDPRLSRCLDLQNGALS